MSMQPARLCRPLVLLAMAALLASCATGDLSRGQRAPGETRAERAAESGRYAEAADVYIDLAGRAAGAEQSRLTLLAIEQWLYAGNAQQARTALRRIPIPEDGELLWLWSSAAAALRLWEGRPDDALVLLEPLSRQPLPQAYRSRIEALRGDAYFQKQEPVKAIELFLQREVWLDSEASLQQNRQRLWAGLKVSDPQVLRDAAAIAADPDTRGWLALGVLANSTGEQGVGWTSGVEQWRERYRFHAANQLLDEMDLSAPGAGDFPSQLAVILPLSGDNAAAGRALRNGILGAYFRATGGLDGQRRVRVYDVNRSGSALRTYEQAVREGAEFVIGPLFRPSVSELADESLLPVPVLALNYLPDDEQGPPGFYQFALAPEDEARAAAERILRDNHRRGLAIVPNSSWGRRVLQSFASELETAGGELLDYRSYEPSNQDYSVEIQELMALSDSVDRYQRLRANIGGPLQFDPRRRQDIDFVFLAADAKSGRLIKSQLKFHYAGDLPVYATSVINSLDERADADLDEVMFAETPWIVDPPAWIADFPALYGEFWPSEKRLARLHAMGYDAYHLVGELFPDRIGPMAEMAGATGTLYLAADGRIHRRLAWARFEGGRPVPLPSASDFGSLFDLPDPGSRD